MLTDPKRDEEAKAKLRWSLHYRSKDAILQSVKTYLRATEREKGANQPPDPGILPIGGAGTHYPRPLFRADYASRFRAVDETPLTAAEQALFPEGLYKFIAVNKKDYPEGALKGKFGTETPWFDVYDTEMYLRERGVQFSPTSTSASVEIAVHDGPGSTTPEAAAPQIEAFLDSLPAYSAQEPSMPMDMTWDPSLSEVDWNALAGWDMLSGSDPFPDLSVGTSFQLSNSDQSALKPFSEVPGLQLNGFGTVGDELGISNLLDPAQEPVPRSGPLKRVLRRKVDIDVEALMHRKLAAFHPVFKCNTSMVLHLSTHRACSSTSGL